MAEQQSTPRPWWLAGAVVALGGVCLYGGAQLPGASRYAGIGPGFFASVVGGVLVLLGLLLGVSILRGERFVPQAEENADSSAPMNPVAFLFALAGACLPILTIRTFGLPLTAAASFVLVARAFGSNKLLTDVVAGVVLGALSWLLFNRLGLQLGGFLPLAGI